MQEIWSCSNIQISLFVTDNNEEGKIETIIKKPKNENH
jgi:hypothetical protein